MPGATQMAKTWPPRPPGGAWGKSTMAADCAVRSMPSSSKSCGVSAWPSTTQAAASSAKRRCIRASYSRNLPGGSRVHAMGPTDEELMSAYVAGDPRAFEKLFSRLAPRVHAFFLRSFRDGAVAGDLVQVTFMKVHRARDKFDQGLRVLPWLFRVAARVALA